MLQSKESTKCYNDCDRSYQEALNGDESSIKHHCAISDGKKELEFALQLANVDELKSGDLKALDVSCGSGYMTHELALLKYNVTGFDLSKHAIKYAQQKYPSLKFFVGDGTKPNLYFSEEKFDFILFREFHPFTRIENLDQQITLIDRYLDMLNQDGIIVIAHARKGGGMRYNSIDFQKAKNYFSKNNKGEFTIVGPYFHLPFKKFNLKPYRLIRGVANFAAVILQLITQARYIEFFVIKKHG
ncbi:MAG: class I SAM-dependent methyltransferase [Gammaproteobacteria bacterium]|jgi:2-polyprenyl-3-methyl-5-hydroxy-6-metoxy-1,4-benzoquinol methylase